MSDQQSAERPAISAADPVPFRTEDQIAASIGQRFKALAEAQIALLNEADSHGLLIEFGFLPKQPGTPWALGSLRVIKQFKIEAEK